MSNLVSETRELEQWWNNLAVNGDIDIESNWRKLGAIERVIQNMWARYRETQDIRRNQNVKQETVGRHKKRQR